MAHVVAGSDKDLPAGRVVMHKALQDSQNRIRVIETKT